MKKYQSSAPGSLMLMGEHAVLHGHQAIVCAINKRITVTLTPREDQDIKIISDAFGEYQSKLTEVEIKAPFHFVLKVVEQFQKQYQSGFELNIESEFSSELGLGSSAAVVVSTIKAISTWLDIKIPKSELFQKVLNVIKSIQGKASGADVSASIHGGVIAFRSEPFSIKKLKNKFPIKVIYSGTKVPTVEVIEKVEHARLEASEDFDEIFKFMGKSSKAAISAIENNDWKAVGGFFDIQQKLLDSIGVNTEALENIIQKLREQPEIFGAKISGAGLGDCVIGIGQCEDVFEENVIDVEITDTGVICESI